LTRLSHVLSGILKAESVSSIAFVELTNQWEKCAASSSEIYERVLQCGITKRNESKTSETGILFMGYPQAG